METIKELKKHLNNCEIILNRFIKKYDVILAYLVINDSISINTYKSLNLSLYSEFDNLTVKEINQILSKLYEEFRLYLEKNNIEYILHINSEYRGWAVSKIIFKFEITN
jgi:hypothetical protein